MTMQRDFNRGQRLSEDGQETRHRMLQMRGWKRLAGDRWLSPYSGLCFDSRGAIDVEQLRGGWAKKMAAAIA